MSLTIKRSDLEEVLEDSEFDSKIRTYSGRGMYGQTCLGFVGNNGTLIEFVKAIAWAVVRFEYGATGWSNDSIKDFYDYMIYNVCTDDMGRETIYYWNSVKLEEE